MLLVGPKVDEDWFSGEDLRILATIAHQSGVAAHNVLLVEELRESRRELERAHRRLITAGEQEQRRLAQELHDGAVQQILSVRYQLAELGRALDGTADEVTATLEDVRDELSAVVSQLREHIGELRRRSRRSRPPPRWGYAHSLEREYGEAMRIIPRPRRSADGALAEMEITLFRVAQEALRNALRHSNAGPHRAAPLAGRGHVSSRARRRLRLCSAAAGASYRAPTTTAW